MITVTTEARDLLYQMLEQAGQQTGASEAEQEQIGIRLAPVAPDVDDTSGQVQLGLALDRPQEGDQIVEHNGRKVLMVNESVGEMLDGITLDTVDTPEGRRLAIHE